MWIRFYNEIEYFFKLEELKSVILKQSEVNKKYLILYINDHEIKCLHDPLKAYNKIQESILDGKKLILLDVPREAVNELLPRFLRKI